jgi:hypothetical protein
MSRYIANGWVSTRRRPKYCPGCGASLKDAKVYQLTGHLVGSTSRDWVISCPHLVQQAQAGVSSEVLQASLVSDKTGKKPEYTPKPAT